VFPTGSWGTVRTVAVKSAMPANPSSTVYSWFVGDYGNCSALCGGGQQRRTVTCLDNLSNAAPASLCPQPAPANNRHVKLQLASAEGGDAMIHVKHCSAASCLSVCD
jgi:hypothetical protein